MKIKELKRSFIKNLSAIYSEEEIGSIFFILTEKFLGLTRLQLALEPEKQLETEAVGKMELALKRLQRHEPVQYITGETSFFGLTFQVNPDVLIPRPETEELVQWILEDLEARQIKSPEILDIGTGSGCIAISLARNFPGAHVTAIDISSAALLTARQNAQLNDVKVEFVQSDILQEEILGQYDVIVSNPPYVREQEKTAMHGNVVEHEPSGALFVSDDEPLVFYKRIMELSTGHLQAQGRLYFELNQYLGNETEQFLRENDFHTHLKKDIFGMDRMLKASKL